MLRAYRPEEGSLLWRHRAEEVDKAERHGGDLDKSEKEWAVPLQLRTAQTRERGEEAEAVVHAMDRVAERRLEDSGE